MAPLLPTILLLVCVFVYNQVPCQGTWSSSRAASHVRDFPNATWMEVMALLGRIQGGVEREYEVGTVPVIPVFGKLRWRSKSSRPVWATEKFEVSLRHILRFSFKTKGKVAGEMLLFQRTQVPHQHIRYLTTAWNFSFAASTHTDMA